MNKVCVKCKATETPQWYSNSTCMKCYAKKSYKDNIARNRFVARNKARLDRKNPTKRAKKNKIRNKFSRTVKGKFGYGKSKAKLRGIPFNLDFNTYEKLLQQGCHYCDKDLTTEVGVGLDRIDNNKGYIKDNVIPCCGNHNKLRGDYLSVKETEVAVCAVLALKNKGKFSINGWKIVVK